MNVRTHTCGSGGLSFQDFILCVCLRACVCVCVIYHILRTYAHTCGSGGLSFEEFKSAVRLLKTRTPIALLPDDFEILTEGGKLTDEEGEFSATQFQRMMRGELKR